MKSGGGGGEARGSSGGMDLHGLPPAPDLENQQLTSNVESDENLPSGSVCRICQDGQEGGELIHPCKCMGSMKYVHRECLDQWRSVTTLNPDNMVRCEVCHHKYEFERADGRGAASTAKVQFLVGLSCLLILSAFLSMVIGLGMFTERLNLVEGEKSTEASSSSKEGGGDPSLRGSLNSTAAGELGGNNGEELSVTLTTLAYGLVSLGILTITLTLLKVVWDLLATCWCPSFRTGPLFSTSDLLWLPDPSWVACQGDGAIFVCIVVGVLLAIYLFVVRPLKYVYDKSRSQVAKRYRIKNYEGD
mmetsp:Transcript_9914/g.19227  ORF Transcript_9914/g.19227 Transcript_9914/m.19227 type:complete len:303 (-) Transcript_9914:189-1097(-)